MITAWPALALALIFGGIGGWIFRLHTAHGRYLVGLEERCRAESAWLEARTAAAIVEIERDAKRVKEDLKKQRTVSRRNPAVGN